MKLNDLKKTTASKPESIEKQEKQSDKKQEVARHMLAALADLGFARLNLREIATRCGISLGSIHYYFKDKNDLLVYGLQLYKDDFVSNLTTMIDDATTLEELLRTTVCTLAGVVEEAGHTHRLWYDLRTQALFDPVFRSVADEIEAHLITLCERFLNKVQAVSGLELVLDAESLYLMIDGLIRYHMQQHLSGNEGAGDRMAERLFEIFKRETR